MNIGQTQLTMLFTSIMANRLAELDLNELAERIYEKYNYNDEIILKSIRDAISYAINEEQENILKNGIPNVNSFIERVLEYLEEVANGGIIYET